MSTSVLHPLNSRAVHSCYASLRCVAFASPKTALHRRGLVLASGFFCSFFLSGAFCVRRRVSPSHANTSACAFAPCEHVFSCAGSQTFLRLFFFLFLRRTFPLVWPPSPPWYHPVRGQVRHGCNFFLSGLFWLLFPSSEVAYSSGRPLASGVFSHPTTRLLPRSLLGPQSLPTDSGLHQHHSVVSSGSHIYA